MHGTSLVVQWLRIHLAMEGTLVRPLVGELRSHMLLGSAQNNLKKEKKNISSSPKPADPQVPPFGAHLPTWPPLQLSPKRVFWKDKG